MYYRYLQFQNVEVLGDALATSQDSLDEVAEMLSRLTKLSAEDISAGTMQRGWGLVHRGSFKSLLVSDRTCLMLFT
jgi:hypothetical protein